MGKIMENTERGSRGLQEAAYRIRPVAGRPYLHICWTEGGKTHTHSTGTDSWDEAGKYREAWLDAQRADPSVDALLDFYLDRRAAAGVIDAKRLREASVPLKAHLGSYQASALDDRAINAYRLARSHCTAGTIRKELVTLKAALNLAHKRGWIPRVPYFEVGPAPAPRERYMTEEQQERLLGAMQGHVHLFTLLGLHTGARCGAILDLTWDRVDFGQGMIDYRNPARPETKKRRAVVPMTNRVRSALVYARQGATTDRVIEWHGRPVKSVEGAFKSAAQRVGLGWVTPHVMRHTCASMLAQHGVDIDTIADYLAADRQTIWRVYRKQHPDYLRSAAQVFDAPNESHVKLQE